MTTDSLFTLCQHHKDAWVSNGSHAVHYRKEPYEYELWDTNKTFLGTTRLGHSISHLAESYEVDLSKGWFLVAHI